MDAAEAVKGCFPCKERKEGGGRRTSWQYLRFPLDKIRQDPIAIGTPTFSAVVQEKEERKKSSKRPSRSDSRSRSRSRSPPPKSKGGRKRDDRSRSPSIDEEARRKAKEAR